MCMCDVWLHFNHSGFGMEQWVNQTGPDARPNGRVVFVRSAQGSIYRSVDDGKNWMSQRDLMVGDEEEPYQARVQQMIFRSTPLHPR